MINLGTVRPGSTIYIPFETFGNSSPAPITITGLATSDIKVYKNGSTTERASASGYTLLDTDGIDFDSLTGIHGVSIDLADNTTADFWTAGGRYFVVIGDITVDSLTMRFIPVMFQIGYAGAMLDTTIATLASQTSFTLTAGPAEDDALNGSVAIIHDIASAVQVGQATVLDYTGSTKTVTLAFAVTFTAAAGDNISILPRTNVYSVGGQSASPSSTIDVNVVSLAGDTQSLTDLKDFADAGYDPATNKVQSVLSVDAVAAGGITASSIATGAIDADALATDAVTEIKAGFTTDLTEILDRLGFLLARETGAVPDAQTAAPVYTITRSGNTFTVTLGGCTSAGIRTAPTLGKT